ncbi:MAG: PEP-CTERM sorting domain-containing protein [Burkholderiaceae bacterium]
MYGALSGSFDAYDGPAFGGGGLANGDQALRSILTGESFASDVHNSGANDAGKALGSYLTASNAPLLTHMSLNGGHDHAVAFRGEDDSIMIGHYSSGSWSKNAFLRAWQDGHPPGSGPTDFVPIVETVTSLPEPSTFALLGLGLLALGIAKRQQKRR